MRRSKRFKRSRCPHLHGLVSWTWTAGLRKWVHYDSAIRRELSAQRRQKSCLNSIAVTNLKSRKVFCRRMASPGNPDLIRAPSKHKSEYQKCGSLCGRTDNIKHNTVLWVLPEG